MTSLPEERMILVVGGFKEGVWGLQQAAVFKEGQWSMVRKPEKSGKTKNPQFTANDELHCSLNFRNDVFRFHFWCCRILPSISHNS